ncbi:MAG: DsrE family protein [bacterium]
MEEENSNILIVQLSDPEKEPEKCIAGLIFARTLIVMEQNIFIFSMARSPLLYTKDLNKSDKIEKRFKQLIDENISYLTKNNESIKIYVCSKSKELLQIEEDMFVTSVNPISIAGMVTLHSLKTSCSHAYFF